MWRSVLVFLNLEQITLSGRVCWCQLSDYNRKLKTPANTSGMCHARISLSKPSGTGTLGAFNTAGGAKRQRRPAGSDVGTAVEPCWTSCNTCTAMMTWSSRRLLPKTKLIQLSVCSSRTSGWNLRHKGSVYNASVERLLWF